MRRESFYRCYHRDRPRVNGHLLPLLGAGELYRAAEHRQYGGVQDTGKILPRQQNVSLAHSVLHMKTLVNTGSSFK